MSLGVVAREAVSGGVVSSLASSSVAEAFWRTTGSSSTAASLSAGSSPAEESSADTWVVATRVSESAIRIASTAEATLADATDDVSSTMGTFASSDGDDGDGENAANPITATRAMMRRPAYAIGIRGLTFLRGSRE